MFDHKKKLLLYLFLMSITTVNAQDSSKTKSRKPTFRNEVGISILTPVIVLAGATDKSNRFSNVTYRYRLSQRHALRTFLGTAIFFASKDIGIYRPVILQGNQFLYYTGEITSILRNVQVAIGYEYMIGSKLKHVFGVDLVYNNMLKKEESFIADPVFYPEIASMTYHKRDSTFFTRTTPINKVGFNFNYSLRYELSRRFIITSSFIAALRFSSFGRGSRDFTTTTLDMTGIVSDISVFYRF